MGMHLISDAGAEFRFTGSGWTYYFYLAQEYGWSPAGTTRPKKHSIFKRWHKRYDSSEGQKVSASDSRAIASSLSRALTDPERGARARMLASRLTEAVRQATGSKSYTMQVDPNDAAYIEQMIEFFRLGAFRIH